MALRLEKSSKKFYGRCQDLIEKNKMSVKDMVYDSLDDDLYFTYSLILVVFLVLHGFVIWISPYFIWLLAMARSMHETDNP